MPIQVLGQDTLGERLEGPVPPGLRPLWGLHLGHLTHPLTQKMTEWKTVKQKMTEDENGEEKSQVAEQGLGQVPGQVG